MSIPPIELNKVNEVFFRTTTITLEQSLEFKEYLSCKAPNYFWSPKYKAGIWDGNISFYNRATQLFPIGLLPEFIKFCKQFQYNYNFNFDMNKLHNELLHEELESFYQEIFKNSNYYPRDYQDVAIFKAIKNKRGIIEQGTGSGKSVVIYTLLRYFMEKTTGKILLVVPVINLVNQMFKDFLDYGFNDVNNIIGLIYSNSRRKDWESRILCSTWQSICKKPQEFYDQFESIIFDEVHHCGSSVSLKTILEKCVHAQYRIGTTGTLPEEKANRLTIFGYLGPIIAQKNSAELIKEGILSNITIANILIKYPQNIVELTKEEGWNYRAEENIIYTYQNRNKILTYILNHIPKDHNVLILCQKIDKHLKIVEEYLKENIKDRKLHVIYGQTDADVREDIRQDLMNKGGNILLASFGTTSTGFNIPRLHEIVLLSSYRSKIKILQSIGRGLRKHEDKEKLIVFDVVDDMTYKTQTLKGKRITIHTNYVYDHFLERLRYYKEQGFKFVTKEVDLESL